MVATFRYLSATNGFVPRTTSQVIGYVRDPNAFKLNQIVQYVPVDQVVGLYTVMSRDEPVRVLSSDEYAFHDGDERPDGKKFGIPIHFAIFRTFRRDFPWTLGQQAIDMSQDVWKARENYAKGAASQLMTARTQRVYTLLETIANWGTHTATATTLNGNTTGKWDVASDQPSSGEYLNILKTSNEVVRRINLATNGRVEFDDIIGVLAPKTAIKMSESAEMRNYLRESPKAFEVVEGLPNPNAMWGLPAKYGNVKYMVENAPQVTERKKASGVEATTNRTFIKDSDKVVYVSRPGGLDGVPGSPSFSTVQIFTYRGNMRVLEFNDTENERIKGHVEENTDEQLVTIYSGFMVQDVLT